MNFMQFLKSLDDLLYEIMSWLVFYPITMWRTLRHPWRMMEYADTELEDSVGQQFTDTLSRPCSCCSPCCSRTRSSSPCWGRARW